MFQDSSLQEQWKISHPDGKAIEISKDKMKHLNYHDLLTINFLHQNYQKNVCIANLGLAIEIYD